MSFVLVLALVSQEAELKFTKWEFARERVGHRVIADAALFNGLESDLEELSLIVVYYDRDLELKRSKTLAIASLPSGKTVPVRIEVEQLPNFNRFQVYLAGGGGKWLFHGEDVLHPPSLKRKEPAKLEVVEARMAGSDVTLVVKNVGQLDALEPTAQISFDGGAKTRVRLAPSMDGASRDTFLVTVPGAPAARTVQATLAWLVAEGPSQKEGETRGVALRRFRTGRLTDGSVRVDGEVGNALDKDVDKVAITFSIGPKTTVIQVPGTFKAGETRSFQAYVTDCPTIDAVSYEVAFESAAKDAKAVAPPPLPASKRLESKGIEIAGPKIPPSAAPPKEAAPAKEATKPEMRIELRGLLVAEGYFNKAGKYTGDVFFLRVAFLDEKGKLVKPNAEFQIALVDGKKEPWKIQRVVTPREWAIDAARINNQTADPAVMACDKKTGELWVGLVRTDGGEFNHKAEIRVEVKDEGSWIWRGMEGKYQSAPRSPDKLEKK
jgi:hypothetical protein